MSSLDRLDSMRAQNAWCGICGQNFERPDCLTMLARHIQQSHDLTAATVTPSPIAVSPQGIEAAAAALEDYSITGNASRYEYRMQADAVVRAYLAGAAEGDK